MRKLALFFLCITAGFYIGTSFASSTAVHVASAYYHLDYEKVKKHMKEHPFLFSVQTFTLNPKVTLNKMQLGTLAWLTYYVTHHLYVRLTGVYLHNSVYNLGYLTGVTRASGIVRPYVEASYTQVFKLRARGKGVVDYDVGFSFNISRYIIPILEFDNFFEKKRFDIQPQLVFPLSAQVSFQIGYAYIFFNGHNAAFLRFNLNF